MKISVVYSDDGSIVVAHEVADGEKVLNGLRQLAGPGEHQAVFDVPAAHAGKKFNDVAHRLHVDVSGAKHHLKDK